MDVNQARHDFPGGGNDQAEFSWSSLAKTIQGVAQDPTVSAIGKTALQMAPSVLGGAASGAMAGGPVGAVLGGGGAILSGLLGPKPAPGGPAGRMPQMAGAQVPQLPQIPQLAQLAPVATQLAQFAPVAAQVMPLLPASAQNTLGPILQLLQNPQMAALLAAMGGGAPVVAAGAARESEAEDEQESVYGYLVDNGFAEER